MRVRAILTVVRDVLALVWGFGGIAIQQYTGNVNIALLSVYVSLITAPGAVALAQLVRGKQETPPTAGSSSASPASSSLPPS